MKDLVSEIGWSFGDNETGLSLIPIHYDSRVNARLNTPITDFAYLVLVTSSRQLNWLGYGLAVEDNTVHRTQMGSLAGGYRNYSKGAVRCVKDSE